MDQGPIKLPEIGLPESVDVPSPQGKNEPVKKNVGFIDALLFGLLGPPDDALTPEQKARKSAKRNNAGSLAKSAQENPGEAFMSAPNPGGSSFGETLASLGKVIRSLGI